MSDYWTIENDRPPNPGVGNALNGLQIQPVYSGSPSVLYGYQLTNGVSPLPNGLYGSTRMPVTFNNVPFASKTWDISAEIPTLGVNGIGSWSIVGLARSPGDVADGDNGEFQAQAGTGIDPEAASSAKA